MCISACSMDGFLNLPVLSQIRMLFAEKNFHVSPTSLTVIIIFSIISFSLLRSMFGLMLARLDEFESLTPLMITPGLVDEANAQQLRMAGSTPQSPPPPRRTPTGKTLIVPLSSNRGRAPLVPLLGTPDSRVTSIDTGTSKSFATIPEDDENAHSPSDNDRPDADLISIDRGLSKTFSRTCPFPATQEVKRQKGLSPVWHRMALQKFLWGGSILFCNQIVLKYLQIPTPSYAPPPPPIDAYRSSLFVRSPKTLSRCDFVKLDNDSVPGGNIRAKKSPSGDSINSFSSPPESSFGTGSPLDTSGSISDSFYLASESDANTDAKAKLYLSDSGALWLLHLFREHLLDI
uniref:Uncharacterized protein n=1 Tax=Ascaris lumbricoides TaxID=6252 RepID=A0A9J2PIE2_ASCLU